jgi:hypothetical protein
MDSLGKTPCVEIKLETMVNQIGDLDSLVIADEVVSLVDEAALVC